MHRPGAAAILLLALLAGGCLEGSTQPPASADGSPPDQAAAWTATLVADHLPTGRAETAVAVQGGQAFVAVVGAGLRSWRATGGGAFEELDGLDGPGDADLASAGAAGTVHWAGLAGESGRIVAQRWERNTSDPAAAPGGRWSDPVDVSAGAVTGDRQFIDARAATVAIAWAGGTGGFLAAVSQDGGRTWGPPSVIGAIRGIHGGIAVSPTGRVAAIHADDAGGVTVSTSDDAGLTWTPHSVTLQTSWIWPSVAFDEAGNLYAVWSTAYDEAVPALVARSYGGALTPMPAPTVQFAASPDGGDTWSEPRAISAPGGSPAEPGRAAFFPWLAAGQAGRLAVSWYEVAAFGGDGQGHVVVATSGDAHAGPDATFEVRTTTPDPVPLGLRCETAASCFDEGPLGESHDVALDEQGRAAVAWLQGESGDAQLWFVLLGP